MLHGCRRNHALGKGTSGFTLIDLLVTIALLALIVAILFPIFTRSRGSGHRKPCQSNLKQIALAFKQYIGDYDERYPLARVGGPRHPVGSPVGWADALQPYLKSPQIYQCEAETNPPASAPTSPGYTDYYYNLNLNIRPGGPGTPIIGLNEAKLTASALTILAGDGSNGDAMYRACGNGFAVVPCAKGTGGIATVPVAQQHKDYSNYAFADGHVKSVNAETATSSSLILDNGVKGGAKNAGNKYTFTP